MLQGSVTSIKNGVTNINIIGAKYYMEEKKIIYEIILSIWNLAKEYNFRKLTDEECGEMTEKALLEEKRFKQHGKEFDLLFRAMYGAIEKYYEGKC